MGLDVELNLPRGAPAPIRESLALENEAVYWFLYPLFDRLKKSHGKLIDINGAVTFRSGEISLLRTLLDRAVELTAQQPPTWSQVWGVQVHPPPKRAVSIPVKRSEVEEWLTKLSRLVSRAAEHRGALVFTGD